MASPRPAERSAIGAGTARSSRVRAAARERHVRVSASPACDGDAATGGGTQPGAVPGDALRTSRLRVLCVEDNASVADAIRLKLERQQDFEWRGWLPTAEGLVDAVQRERPALVLLDLDMPGPDPVAALVELARVLPAVRTVIFSGHVRLDLIERALEAGAWGYVAKTDGETSLVSCLRRVAAGEFVLSPQVRAVYGG